MNCFQPAEYCTETYHSILRYQETKILELYFNVREFEKLIVKNFPKTINEIQSLPNLESEIEEDLSEISDQRNVSSCSGFKNYELKDGGCHDFSSFENQKVSLDNMCKQNGTSPVNRLKMQPIPELTCQKTSSGSLQWNIDPSDIVCVADCISFDEGVDIVYTKVGDKRNLIIHP